jgi:ABC-2 type transport system ATP-binding protein
MSPLLAIEDLRKTYGKVPALTGVDLTIEAGEICALLGPNGAGKSTLVSIVAGLMRPDSGSVTVNGIDAVGRSRAARAFIGLAAQDLAIYPSVSVRANLTMFGQLLGLKGPQLRGRVTDAADAMDLGPLLNRQARHLSGGEKRRLHTAIAVLARPPLLILDEPTAGVDVATRARMVEAVRELAAQDGSAVCYSTHYLGEVESLGASVAILDRGCVIARGDTHDLIRRHAQSAVELVFDTQPPALDFSGHPDWKVETDRSTMRISGDAPTTIAAEVLGRLDAARAGLRSVDFVAPGLETVFLALTGRRWEPREHTDPTAESPPRDSGPGRGQR